MERQNLAEIHKRIREEKQNSGRILTVQQAKKLIEGEKKGEAPKKVVKPSPAVSERKNSLIDRKRTSAVKDKAEPKKLLPLSRINKSKREQAAAGSL